MTYALIFNYTNRLWRKQLEEGTFAYVDEDGATAFPLEIAAKLVIDANESTPEIQETLVPIPHHAESKFQKAAPYRIKNPKVEVVDSNMVSFGESVYVGLGRDRKTGKFGILGVGNADDKRQAMMMVDMRLDRLRELNHLFQQMAREMPNHRILLCEFVFNSVIKEFDPFQQ